MKGDKKDSERIEEMVSPARDALKKANISAQPFIQLLKKYSKGSRNKRVINRYDSWTLIEYILQKSVYKLDIRKREFRKASEKKRDIIMTYYAFMDKDLMHKIAKDNFKSIPFYEKLHDIADLCKEWVNLVDNVHQNNNKALVPDESFPARYPMFEEDDRDYQFPNDRDDQIDLFGFYSI